MNKNVAKFLWRFNVRSPLSSYSGVGMVCVISRKDIPEIWSLDTELGGKGAGRPHSVVLRGDSQGEG